MIFEDSGSRSDLLGTLCGACCNIVIAQQVQGELKTQFLGELLQPKDLACTAHVGHSRQGQAACKAHQHPLRKDLPAPGACQFWHSQHRYIPPAREVPLRGWVKGLLIEAIRTAFPRVVRGDVEASSRHSWFSRHTEEVGEIERSLPVLRQQFVDDRVGCLDFFVNEWTAQCDHVLPLVIFIHKEHFQCFQVRAFVPLKLFVCGSALPSPVLFPDEGILGGLLPKVLLHPVVAVVGPKVLRLLAIKCVDEAMIGHPVLRDDCTGQGFHQAKTIVQSAIGVNCNAQRSIRPDTRILAFNFPRRMSGHIHMTLA